MSAYSLVFYDDARARTFEPFALSRPFCEMRAGALLIRERWEFALNAASRSFVGGDHLAHFTEVGAPGAEQSIIPAGTVLVNSRAAIALRNDALVFMRRDDKSAAPTCRTWYVDGKLAAVQLRGALDAALLTGGNQTLEQIAAMDLAGDALAPNRRQPDIAAEAVKNARVDVKGVWMEEVWDIVRHLSPMLMSDIEPLAAKLPCSTSEPQPHAPGTPVFGNYPVYAEKGAVVEPYVVFDTTLGPILLRAGSTVQSFTRAVGPLYLGRDSMLMGERVSGSSIGDTCRVHGELSATVFLGFANKGHDGFVGHSIVGRWVNMGAGTITSNLKNTYGTVALWTPSGVRDTGMQFLGTLFGDHAKTGIGIKLTTGCVLGLGANVFDRMPPKAVEPFAWGSGVPYDTYDATKFIETAERMMSRRHVALTDDGKRALMDSHAARWRTP